MAKKKQPTTITADELIQVLKFTPRVYKIEVTGYGGEVVMGTIDRNCYNYIKEHNIDIDEMVGDFDNELEIPDEHRFIEDGSWYDCDNIAHGGGVEFSDQCMVTVLNETGDPVWSCSLDPDNLEEDGCSVTEFEVEYIADHPDEVVFFGQSTEKGLFFGGDINLKSPFDPAKLSFSYGDYEGWQIGSSISYDNEDIDNDDYGTTGKSIEFSLYDVVANTPLVQYKPVEKDNGVGWPDNNYYPDDNEIVEVKFKKHKPVQNGWYKCRWGNVYGSCYGKLYWNGSEFVTFEHGKEEIIDQPSIVEWSGLNWDTSNWANCPQKKEDEAN